MGLYGGRISVSQPDPCLAEQLFHDGDASAQIDAIRALAERPLGIQGAGKVTTVYDVHVSELPVRVIGDCLRGSSALHSSLTHTPAVRAQAALAIAQVMLSILSQLRFGLLSPREFNSSFSFSFTTMTFTSGKTTKLLNRKTLLAPTTGLKLTF